MDIARFDAGTPSRGRRRSITPGAGAGAPKGMGWFGGSAAGDDARGGSAQRSRGRRRAGSCAAGAAAAGGVAAAAAAGSTGRARTPAKAHEPLWFAHTSDSLAPAADPKAHIRKPSATERLAQQRHPAQRHLMSDDVLVKAPRPLEPHLVGTEKEWFPGRQEDAPAAPGQHQHQHPRHAAREKSVDAINEEQYRLHKIHDAKKKEHKDTCDDRFCKGRGPVSVRTKQDYQHHYDAFWFGALPEKSEAARSADRRPASNPLQDEGSYARGRKSISRASNTCHQQEKLTGLKEMQDCDRSHSGRIRKRLFQGHNALRVESLQTAQEPAVRQPYHFDPPFGITRVGYAKENMTPRHMMSTPWADDYTGCSAPTSARQVLAARRNPLADAQPPPFQTPPCAGYARPQSVRNRKDLL